MKFFKNVKTQIIAIFISVFFLFVALFIYISPINIDNKTNYDVPANELI